MAWPKNTELAVLLVNGQKYTDWETVSVRKAVKDVPPFTCRFTCSEMLKEGKLPSTVATLQIKPGDKCSVTLAGIPAFNGEVMSRQVFYDARRHMVEIQCGTFQDVINSTVVHSTMEWKDKTFQQIAQEVLKNIGVNLKIEGALPNITFPRVSATHGESVHDFLDNLARALGQKTAGLGVNFTTNLNEDFVVVTNAIGGGDSVTEGVDILEGREIIYNPGVAANNPQLNQSAGSNENWGAKVTHLPFFSEGIQALSGVATKQSVTLGEIPTFDKTVLQGRSSFESGFQRSDQVTVFATVYGWLRPSGGLWDRWQYVSVTSPMLIMNGTALIAKSVTFTQDSSRGTRTTLELCNEAAMGGTIPQAT